MKNQITKQSLWKRISSKGVFPYQYAFTFLIPLRNFIFSPKQLIQRIELKQNFNVLEVGPGPGYFSIPVATKLIHGTLYLADIQQGMLDYAKKRVDKRKLKNVKNHLCNGKSFDFKDDFFDLIYMVTVLGEVENKSDYLEEFHRMLKPEGVISITELAGDPDKITTLELKEMAEQHNFKLSKQFGNKRNYTLNFKKT